MILGKRSRKYLFVIIAFFLLPVEGDIKIANKLSDHKVEIKISSEIEIKNNGSTRNEIKNLKMNAFDFKEVPFEISIVQMTKNEIGIVAGMPCY